MENDKLCMRDLDDDLTQAVFKERQSMGSADWLSMTEGDNHPIAWWCEEPTNIEEYLAAQVAMSRAVAKTRLLLKGDTLSENERKAMQSFLKMIAAQEGPIKVKDKTHYFVHTHIPWVHFVKEALYNHPYRVFSTIWTLMLALAVSMAATLGAWPVFTTFFLLLATAAVLITGVAVKDSAFKNREYGKYVLHPLTRFWAILPIDLLLIGVFLLISIFGVLPINMNGGSKLVVSRDGTVQRTVAVKNWLVRYPNLWELTVRGDELRALPKAKEDESISMSLPSLPKGTLLVAITSTLRPQADLVNADYNALSEERFELRERAKALVQNWCNSYRVEGPNESLTSALGHLSSAHFTIQTSPVKISWTEEKTVPTEKLATTSVTTTKEEKVVVAEKVTTPKELWSQ